MGTSQAAAEPGVASERPASIRALLAEPLDEVGLLVYVKDHAGRYLRVNSRFLSVMGTTADIVVGKADDELPSLITIDGPRLRDGRPMGSDSAQLAYVVDAAGNRPELAVWRFALTGSDGEVAGTCGLAAPLAEASAAAGECERLLALATAATPTEADGSDGPELTLVAEPVATELLDVVATERLDAVATERLDAVAAELSNAKEALETHGRELAAARQESATLRAELDAARERVDEAERLRTHAEADRKEWEHLGADARHHVVVLQDAVAALKGEMAELTSAQEVAQGELRTAQADGSAAHDAIAGLQQQLAAARETVAGLQHQLATSGEELTSTRELAATGEELSSARRELAVTSQELTSTREQLAAAGEELTATRQQLAAARDTVAGLQHQLAASGEELTSTRQQLAASGEELSSTRRELLAAQAAIDAVRAAPEPAPADPPPQRPRPEPVPAEAATDGVWGPPAQRALAAGLAEATEWTSALKTAAKTLGTEGGWPAVVAWLPDERAPRLRCGAMWVDPAAELERLETATWQQLPVIDAEPIAAALRSPSSVSVAELDPNDRRLGVARERGMRFAVRVRVGPANQAIALLELLSAAEPDVDPLLALALDAVAIQLAQIEQLMRLSAQPRWALSRF